MTFHQGLGSYRDKSARMEKLVEAMGRQGLLAGDALAAAKQAARLAKADLVTLMVREFPELQGVMGGIYLAGEGAPDEVATAVRWHYQPVAVEPDAEPAAAFAGADGKSRVFAAVALADKLDTLAGYFGLGESPTGSRDPYGLRRAGQGAVRAVLDFWRPKPGETAPDLQALLAAAVAGYGALKQPADKTAAPPPAFLLDRLAYVLQARGFSTDEVGAVIARRSPTRARRRLRRRPGASGRSPTRSTPGAARRRCSASAARSPRTSRPWPRPSSAPRTSSRRQAPAATVDPALFEADAERALFEAASALEQAAGSYEDRLRGLASLRAPVGRFFDDVLVMAEDPRVRAEPARSPQSDALSLLPHRGHFQTRRYIVTQYVFFFGGGKADGNKDMKDTLGGKGAGLAEMTNAGVPVPPGFTISTQACNAYYDSGGKLPAEVDQQMDAALAKLEALQGKKLGDPADPLLVSVRSGSKFSMPGMMDTILNLGMNDQLGRRRRGQDGQPPLRPATATAASSRCTATSCSGIDKDKFEHELSAVKKKYKAQDRRRARREGPRRGDRALQGGRAEGHARSPSRRTRASSWWAPATPCSSRG